MICAKFGWNWPSGSEEDENVKSLQKDWQMDDRGSERSLELLAQVSWNYGHFYLTFFKTQIGQKILLIFTRIC